MQWQGPTLARPAAKLKFKSKNTIELLSSESVVTCCLPTQISWLVTCGDIGGSVTSVSVCDKWAVSRRINSNPLKSSHSIYHLFGCSGASTFIILSSCLKSFNKLWSAIKLLTPRAFISQGRRCDNLWRILTASLYGVWLDTYLSLWMKWMVSKLISKNPKGWMKNFSKRPYQMQRLENFQIEFQKHSPFQRLACPRLIWVDCDWSPGRIQPHHWRRFWSRNEIFREFDSTPWLW